MKLGFIGDSHVAMFIQATFVHPSKDVENTFFAKSQTGPVDVEFDHQSIRATGEQLSQALRSKGMPTEIQLDAHDAIVLVAMLPSIFFSTSLTAMHQVFNWPSFKRRQDDFATPFSSVLPRPFLSREALMASLVGVAKSELSYNYVAKIRARSEVPIFIVPQPYPSVSVLERPRFKRVLKSGDGPAHSALLNEVYAKVFDSFSNVKVITQPMATIEHGFLSKLEFMRGASRLSPDQAQPKRDVLHANHLYGQLVLDEILSSALNNG